MKSQHLNVTNYVNKHGSKYYFHLRHGAKRGPKFVARRLAQGATPTLPPGYEVRESVNGHVSVRKCRISRILEIEAEMVRCSLKRLRPHGYSVQINDRNITIFASAHDRKSFSESLDAEFAGGFAAALDDLFAAKYGPELATLFRESRSKREPGREPRFYPLLRFELSEAQKRMFLVKRIYFTGDQDWLTLETLPLFRAVTKYVPHLGRDSFFDLL